MTIGASVLDNNFEPFLDKILSNLGKSLLNYA